MLKNKSSDSTESCTLCAKNSEQLKRYEQLISLYRKKQSRESVDCSKASKMGHSSQCSALLPSQIATHRLVQLLQTLLNRRCTSFFDLAQTRSAKKFVCLNLCNRLEKSCLKEGFQALRKKSQRNLSVYSSFASLEEKMVGRLKSGFFSIKQKSGISVVQQQISDHLINQKEALDTVIKSISSCKPSMDAPIHEKFLRRRNMELELINNKLCLQNQFLRKCLDQSSRRQAKQNQKKSDSLEMLAEELREKNQLIIQLQSEIRMYEDKYQTSGNVLEDDYVTLKKEAENFQRLKDRFENEMHKSNQKLEKNSAQLLKVQKELSQIKEEKERLLKQSFENTQISKKATKTINEYEQLIKIFNRKLKRIDLYEKALQAGSKKLDEKTTKEEIIDQTKTELVLCFLANISAIQYKLHHQNLFEKEEIEFLEEHKTEFLKNQCEAQEILKKDDKNFQGLDISQFSMRGGRPSQSIFCVLDSPRKESVAQQKGNPSITLKIMELQIEKKKKMEKISELKDRLMHIRVIILNLLKSFELQVPVKSETDGILNVLFQIFEYSEGERESIFTKKKKLFGFI